jgi:hypothetical protein
MSEGTHLKKMNRRRVAMLLLLFSASTLFLSVIIPLNEKTAEYAGNIILAHAPYWTCAIFSITLAVTAGIIARQGEFNLVLKCSGVLITASVANVLLFGRMFSYFAVGRGDLLTQIGQTSDLVSEGVINDRNFYPGTHILAASLELASGIDVAVLFAILIVPIWLIFFLFLLSYSRRHMKCRKVPLIALVIPAFLPLGVMHTSFLPMSVAIVLLLIVLHLGELSTIRNHRSRSHLACYLTTVAILPVYHPLVAIVAVAPIALMSRVDFLRPFKPPYSLPLQIRSRGIAVFAAVTTISWIVMFGFWKRTLNQFISWTLGDEVPISSGEKFLSLVSLSSVSVLEIASILVFTYGVFLLLSILLVVLVIQKRRSGVALTDIIDKALVSGAVLSLGLEAIVFIAPTGLDVYRMIWLTVFFVSLFVVRASVVPFDPGQTSDVHRTTRGRKWNRMKGRGASAFCALVFILAAILGPISCYRGPWVLQASDEVTYEEVSGTVLIGSLLSSDSGSVVGFGTSHRLFHAANGFGVGDSFSYYSRNRSVPDHFGYDTHQHAGESLPPSAFVIMTSYERYAYEHVWKDADLFSHADFDRFDTSDSSVDRIIDCGDIILYFVG